MTDLNPINRFRATGRTSRAINAAIEKAKDGRYVFFLTGSKQEAERALRLAYDELRREYGPDDIRVANPKIYIPARETKKGGGSISFEYIKDVHYDWELGKVISAHTSCIAIVDPYAVEACFGPAIRAYHEYDPVPGEIRYSPHTHERLF